MQPAENPYASPVEVDSKALDSAFRAVRRRLFWQGLAMTIAGVGMPVFFSRYLWMLIRDYPEASSVSVETMRNVQFMAGYFCAVILGCLFCIYGGIQLMRMRQYYICLAASIVWMFPLTSPCHLLGLIFGGWAFIDLLRKDTRAAFAEGK